MIKLFLDHPLIGTLLLVNFTWIYFCAIMRLQQVRDAGQLTGAMKLLGYPNLLIGVLLDAAVNVFPFSLLFWEFPRWDRKEFLTTARLCRWYETAPDSWRGKQAAWWGRTLLNPIDPSGQHIK